MEENNQNLPNLTSVRLQIFAKYALLAAMCLTQAGILSGIPKTMASDPEEQTNQSIKQEAETPTESLDVLMLKAMEQDIFSGEIEVSQPPKKEIPITRLSIQGSREGVTLLLDVPSEKLKIDKKGRVRINGWCVLSPEKEGVKIIDIFQSKMTEEKAGLWVFEAKKSDGDIEKNIMKICGTSIFSLKRELPRMCQKISGENTELPTTKETSRMPSNPLPEWSKRPNGYKREI